MTLAYPTDVRDPKEQDVARYSMMGRVVASDFRFHDLTPAPWGKPAALSLLSADEPFPPEGRLVRELTVGHDRDVAIRLYDGPNGIHYRASGVLDAWVEPSGRIARYKVTPGARSADVAHILSGPITGLAIQLQGDFVLHAAAADIGGFVVAMVADHGYGKSTMAAFFLREGYPLLSDDMLPVWQRGSEFVTAPSVPRIKLWSDSLAAMGLVEEDHEFVVSWLDKRRVPVEPASRPAQDRLPLRAIYFLDPRGDPAAPTIVTPLSAKDGVFAILAGTYMADSLCGTRAAGALDCAARIANGLPLRRISYYRSFENLPAIRDAILQDAEGIASSGQ